MRSRATLFIACALLGGCATSPSVGVLGAFFPDWLFCMVGAIVVTALIHAGLRAAGLLRHPGRLMLPVVYSALTMTLALVGWLIFFQN